MSSSNVLTALEAIIVKTKTKEFKEACEQVAVGLDKKSIAFSEAVKILSEFILNFEDALLFKEYFSNILLALVSIQIPLQRITADDEKLNHLENCVVLALLADHPDIAQYALNYFEINPVPPYEVYLQHESSYTVAPKKPRLHQNEQNITVSHVVTCCYTLLIKLPNQLSSKWDWSEFITAFAGHESTEIRWMVKECMSVLTNMTEIQAKNLADNLKISKVDDIKFACRKKETQVIPIEDCGVQDIDLNTANVINIDGILLPVFEKDNVQIGTLVPVKSTVNNLRSLALAIASGKALSLIGPVGSGKTSLVEYLAAITGRRGKAFKKVQLGDQTDSRMLLGTHQCTDIPGEFVWRPGVLTEAVQNGHWLLLEDIDCAALDIASTLSSLLERNILSVPGYCDSLPVTPGFQLFVTQRTMVTNYGFQKKMSSSSTLLQKHLTQINIEPLSRSELGEIVKALYPSLNTICSRMIEVFMMFSVGSHDTSLENTETFQSNKDTNINWFRGSRLISTRDLIKWCSRSVIDYDVTSPESALKVLQDALDIFTCSVANPEDRLQLAKNIGTCLGIVETKSEFYCKHHKPNVSLNPSILEVGRAKIIRVQQPLESIDFDKKEMVFSFTRQSACLLERIACCVMSNEPVLLVGETGTGKTSSVQYLAEKTGHKLVVINMNQQSDSADLLGGYKPVDLKYVIKPIKLEFKELFSNFYNVVKNKKFLSHIETCYNTGSWRCMITLIKQSHAAAVSRLSKGKTAAMLARWKAFGDKVLRLEKQIKAASQLTFAFIEGSLVKAMQEGYWVLLDEINLASPEILECLAGLLEDKNESIDLIEKGDKLPIHVHSDFTLFACMNPATDVGKKDLPAGLRNRFTELFVDELVEKNDIILLIGDYLYSMNLSGSIMEGIYHFYINLRKSAKDTLVDGAGNAPHYSLRTLCRALTAAAKAKCGTVSRSLYESFCLSFLTQLDSSSHPKVEAMITKAVIGKKNIKSVLGQLIPEPQMEGLTFLLFEGHWISKGKLDITIPEGYILTPTVRKNLRDIARVISLGKLPVLLQGDTSVGKTSLITYIAKTSGNYCVRINNHEHTDLQEYIGSYASDANGKLVFKEGVLVEAMRKGYWIILDELNLAPSDVLEALNRVLDDNRELYIPETQQVVKAHPHFMLFATQNPPGLYGGRKMLSRAFRNRFVELHFDEIPRKELETILHQRCHIPPSYCKKMIAVMADLQVRRRGSAAVLGKDGFITLRDLFRWGIRYKLASTEILTDNKFYDWDQHIADEGYLILAGKVRQCDERNIIEEVIEKHIKRKVDSNNLFSLHQTTSPVTKSILETILNNTLPGFSHVFWTFNMRRLAVLIAKSFIFYEPVLLVGETGCGKTTICQVLAALRNTKLLSINCHMHTESSDFLGGLRPVPHYKNDGRLFEWVDGPLIKAMQNGFMFLADEISLADDSVLERLNSLLEPERQILLAEKGTEEGCDILEITAANDFHFISTMNPGGDFGKKELSPALRNRFTEIWCDNNTPRDDLLKVLERNVNEGISLGNQEDGSSGIGNCILNFTDWLKKSEVTNKFPFSIRDLLSWVYFINSTVSNGLLETPEAYVHGACITFLDCFGTTLTGHIDTETLQVLRKTAINYLLSQITLSDNICCDTLRNMLSDTHHNVIAESDQHKFGIKPFYIPKRKGRVEHYNNEFTFTAPTTGANTLRLLRGLQLNKAVLLEGNPGVGKTSLVTALAKASGHRIVRINLSDQTDITDLFGIDLPSEDGFFVFKEGVFLKALQNGDWILLDELNLAPQPVLEGLNACLDHRGEVYIPELGKSFKVQRGTRFFACQNPLRQGGARRGLPLSFLNRFTQVFIDTLTPEDLRFIIISQYPSISEDVLHKIVKFNCRISHEINVAQLWGHKGSPWEMNLRDIQRWCEAIVYNQNYTNHTYPGKFVDMLYVNRMRTQEDKQKMIDIYNEYFYPDYPKSDTTPMFGISETELIFGDVRLRRNIETLSKSGRVPESDTLILRHQLPALKALAQNINMGWLSIIVGSSATGKSSALQVLADLTGNELQIVPVTSAMDVSDLLGGFEQVDYNRSLRKLFQKLETITMLTARNLSLMHKTNHRKAKSILTQLYTFRAIQTKIESTDVVNNVNKELIKKVDFLLQHCDMLLNINIIDSDICSSLIELKLQISKLKGKFVNMNVGGKFEWVDSALVKSLTEGRWLLLDNVNLTSAAVLDRLNSLLETDGILSIPERGEVSEIKRHPNFKIFFTMDPKYGEISRAMRNRGVELFIIQTNEWNANLTDTMPYMDLFALIDSCGLPSEFHKMIIEAHTIMTSYVQGWERLSFVQLLQAAYLVSQQIARGIPPRAAIINSFSDVYIKPRCGGDFSASVITTLAEMKNIMLKALQSFVCNYQLDVTSSTQHTLSVAALCKNSSYETVKQTCYPLLHLHLEDNSHNFQFCSDLLIAYDKCPNKHLDVTYNILQQELDTNDNDSIKMFSLNLNNIGFEVVAKRGIETFKRYYTEAFKLKHKETQAANAEYLILYNNLINVLLNLNIPKNKFSALDYSKAVLSGELTDDFTDYPILKNCHNYVQLIDKFITKILKCKEAKINDLISCKIVQLLNWKSRFINICTKSIFVTAKFKRRPLLREETVSLLNMHFKWLQKYLISELLTLLPSTHEHNVFFRDTLNNMLMHSIKISTVINKVGRKLRKLNGQPTLYETEAEYELCVTKAKLLSKISIDLNQPIVKQNLPLMELTVANDSNLALDIPDECILNRLQEAITYISAVTKDNRNIHSEMTLLPMTDYILIRIINLLQNHFLNSLQKIHSVNSTEKIICNFTNENIFQMDFVNLLMYLVESAKGTKGFSLEFANLLALQQKIMASQNVMERVSAFGVKFWNEFYKKLVHTPATYPHLFSNISGSEDFEDISSHNKLSINLPLMLHYMQNLTISSGSYGGKYSLAYEMVPLQDRIQYSIQLNRGIHILWKNMAMLNSATNLKVRSDAIFEVHKYEQLMCYLFVLVSPEETHNIIYSNKIYEEVIEYMQSHLINEDKSFINFIKGAHDNYSQLLLYITNDTLIASNKMLVKTVCNKLSLFTGLVFLKLMTEISPLDEVEKHRLKVSYIEEDVKMFDTLLSSYYMQGIVSGTILELERCDNSSDVKPDYYKLGNPNRESLGKVHPFCQKYLNLKEETMKRISKYSHGNTFRPSQPSYLNFYKDCTHFTKSVLSMKTTEELCKNAVNITDSLLSALKSAKPCSDTLHQAQTVFKENSSWIYSVNAFYKKIEVEYSEAFPDLAKPLLSSLSQMLYNITNLNDAIKELQSKIESGPELRQVAIDLMSFPNNIPSHKYNYLHRFIDTKFIQFMNKSTSSDNENNDQTSKLVILDIYKMNLSELKMYCLTLESIDDSSIDAMASTLNYILMAWDKQQKEVQKRKDDEDALYVTKSKCEDIDEDIQALEEISEMFPSYSDTDFSEFKSPTLEQKKINKNVTHTDNRSHLVQTIKQEDISLVYNWHSSVVHQLTSAEWLHQPNKVIPVNFVKPIMQRYPIYSMVIDKAWDALDADLEGILSPTLLLMASNIKDTVEGDDTHQKKVDFYRSPWVSESGQCLPLLEEVKETVNLLLDQWPDFPTLKDILLIVNRILTFPMSSPVARFLTGLELLRDKIEEWNKNAHKKNNMIDISLAVGQQIINWRKLEMAHWKDCLNNVYVRKQSEAHKYWFFLYDVIMSYLKCDNANNEQMSSVRIVSTLRDFMEKSTLCEYQVRLEILYTYHAHLVHLDKTDRRDELLSILWNTYNYYDQFSLQVSSYIKDKRTPIEKKLKDFVKISSWDRDLSYWSVKDTVDKAHKVLHKHTKEFEKMLMEGVGGCLVIDNSTEVIGDHVGIWDRPKRTAINTVLPGGAYLTELQNYIALNRNIKKFLDKFEIGASYVPENSLLAKVPTLFNKAKVLCKHTMSHTNYPTLVQGLNDFVNQIIETSLHLGSLEVDSSVPKEKQTSQAKSILQQKRKALADLFRYLTKIGLNYRTGLVLLSASDNNLYDFTMPPVDLDAALSYLKNRRCDTSLSLLWSGCEKYFQKNIARHKLLRNALQTPHQDLGLQNMDRCKGFAAILMKMTNAQKKSISKYSRHLCDLRNTMSNLTAVLDLEGNAKISNGVKQKIHILSQCYVNIVIVLEQFCVLLESCPENDIAVHFEPSFDSVLSNSQITKCYKNTEEWKRLLKIVKSILTVVTKQKKALTKLNRSLPNVFGKFSPLLIITQNHIDIEREAEENLANVKNEISILLEEYQFKFKSSIIEGHTPDHPILQSIVTLSKYIETISLEINNMGETVFEPMQDDTSIDMVDDFTKQSEDLVATMLLIIQSIYKNHLIQKEDEVDVITAIDDIIDEHDVQISNEEEQKEVLEDNHLKDLLQDKLSRDIKMLQFNGLNEKARQLHNKYIQCLQANVEISKIKEIANRVVPILEQTILFVQYFFTQQVALHRVSCKLLSVLLKIFSDLSSKGFCKPADLDMEDGEGDGSGQFSSGTGLGEGEGQKDVSDKIENQDQLDDAKRPGEEEKNEDKDCKEEENGVNMTDDFDSHLQDIDKKDAEASEDDDEDDADKQMGDTDNAAEKLDQQIWGEDNEDIDEEESQKESEDKGKGESTGEKEISAKEEEQATDDGTEGKEKKQKKNVNEMEEPEIDDDHIDPYHGNQEALPEPEDFEMPENINLDGDENGEDKEGETETENPFEIDVMKDNIPEDKEDVDEDTKEQNKNDEVMSISSDGEDNDEHDKEQEGENENDEQKGDNSEKENEDDNVDGEEAINDDNNTEVQEDNTENPDEPVSENHKNPDETDNEEKVEKREDPNPEANPSNNDPSKENDAENAEMEYGTDDNVQTNPDHQKDEDAAPYEQAQEQVGDEKQSTGRSELDKSDKGHKGQKEKANRANDIAPKEDKQKRYENKPGRTEEERTLGEVNDKKQRKTHTLNVENEDEAMDEGGNDDPEETKEADAYQHVKKANKDDIQAVDSATKEQADQQPILHEDEAEEMKPDDEVPMDVDDEDIQVEKADKEISSEKMKEGADQDDKAEGKNEGGEERTGETAVEVEGETILTEVVPRGTDTTYHTRLHEDNNRPESDMAVGEYISIRQWLSTGLQSSGSREASVAWRSLWQETSGQARALSERLRLVLEPTGRSRLAGDFRTGKRINMRRVIPYIASHFRKDRIWLRRTKPAKREYKIAVAIDDSSSMSDNRSKELAFESLALVSQALNLLESGDLAVLSFGEQPNVLHPFSEQFSEHSGAKILEKLLFNQTKTRIAQLLDFSTVMFEEQTITSDTMNAKLLVIVSDGRGIFSEGEPKVLQSVRRARQQGIFLVYVIIDNPDNKDSIMDIRRPHFDPVSSDLVGFIPYLDTFPFPFYLILRDMSALPTVLGDAMRQWFELAANNAT